MSQSSRWRWLLLALVPVLVALPVVAAYSQAPVRAAAAPPDPQVVAVLRNIQAHGYNPCTNGLYINWVDGAPGKVNMNGTGHPDADPCARHDTLTDLRYLQALSAYRAADPSDGQFDGEFVRYDTIVKREFAATVNPRGWVYFVLLRIAVATGDTWYSDTARHLAQSYARVGNTTHPDRVDWHIEEAGAMVDAGKRFNDAKLRDHGKATLEHWWKVGYRPSIGLVTNKGNEVEPSEIAEEAEALWAAGETDKAQGMLARLDALWDPAHGGYYAKATYASGTLTVDPAKHDPGRMAEVLRVLQLTGDTARADRLRPVLRGPGFYAPGHGVLFETRADYSLVKTTSGVPENWITTEAMGCWLAAFIGQ